jgi:hypothetical protein
VGLLLSAGAVASLGFVSPAEAPPEGVASLGAELEVDVPPAFSASPEAALVEDAPPEPVEDFPVVLVVELLEDAFAAALSALVLFGGVISGVLCGTGSDTLLPPQALRPSPASSATASASAGRAGLKAGPCACRTLGSR